MAFASYDPKQVIVIVGGAPISGYADGTFVEVAFDEQQFNKTTGADGLTQRTKTNNYAGSMTITLLQGSSGNDVLSALWNADRYENAGAVPIIVKDLSGRTLWAAQHGWVQQMPNNGFSKDAEDRAWVIDCDELTGIAGGNGALAGAA
jgi:hypothetical protein